MVVVCSRGGQHHAHRPFHSGHGARTPATCAVGSRPADAWLVDYTRTLNYSIGGGLGRRDRTRADTGAGQRGLFHEKVAWHRFLFPRKRFPTPLPIEPDRPQLPQTSSITVLEQPYIKRDIEAEHSASGHLSFCPHIPPSYAALQCMTSSLIDSISAPVLCERISPSVGILHHRVQLACWSAVLPGL